MRNLYGVLSISLLACVAVNSAYGALASKGYVDSWKVDMLQGVEKANRALVTNQFGKVIVGQITKDMIADGAVTSGKIADGVIPTVGNGTITIKQTGKSDQTFTVNQGGNTTITLSDNDTKYTLPTASGTTKGGVKIGANVNVASDGTISVAAPKTKVSELTNDAGYLTAATLPADKDTKYTAGKHVAISDTNVITTTYKAGSNIAIADDGTISATDTKYTLPAATTGALGGVKSGNDIAVSTDGTMTVNSKFATDTEVTNKINALDVADTVVAGQYVSGVSETDGKIKVTRAALPVDKDTTYTAGTNITIDTNNKISVTGTVANATNATKATQDASGNVITTTYATKADLANKVDNDTKYTAGKHVAISDTNVITTTYKAGSNIAIADDGTISATDTKYTLPTASGTTKGGVKIGANVNVASDGTISVAAPKTKVSELTNDAGYLTAATLPKVDNASAADTATKATQDASGNVITETYATKTELTNKIDALDSSVTGATGKVITSVTQTDGKLTGTMDYIKVPVGSATAPTSMANIWIE